MEAAFPQHLLLAESVLEKQVEQLSALTQARFQLAPVALGQHGGHRVQAPQTLPKMRLGILDAARDFLPALLEFVQAVAGELQLQPF